MTQAVRDGQAGITLIEMMVVLAVIGVATGAAMMGLGNRDNNAQTEAVRLARHLTLGVDEALITGRPLALVWDAKGYSFGQMPAGQAEGGAESWPAALPAMLGQRHDLKQPLELASVDASLPASVLLPASGAAAAVTFNIAGADSDWTVTFDGFTAVAMAKATP